MPFRVEETSKSDGRPIVNLPNWAWLFGNDFDGLQGDKRGQYADMTPFKLPVEHWFSMWWWAAVRNPVNNARFTKMFSAPITGATITYVGDYEVKDNGRDYGSHFIKSEKDGRSWYGYWLVKRISKNKALVIRMGFKIKPSHAGITDVDKGMTFKIGIQSTN